MTNKTTQELLFTLAGEDCIISPQHGAARTALDMLKKYSPEARFDRLGNIIAPVCAHEGKAHIMLEAHMDEIGFAVTSIDKDGFLRVAKAGGPDLHVLLGHEVRIQAKKELLGVFCCRPPHLTTSDDYKKAPQPDELAVDIGMDESHARQAVSPGDYIFLRQKPETLLNGMVTGKAFDNRAGMAAILRCLQMIEWEKCNAAVTVLFSMSEETGLNAVKAGTFSIRPTHAISFDVSFASAPGIPREKCGESGRGPMIGVSPALSKQVTDTFFRLAQEKGIPCQTEVMPGGTGTNGDAISITGEGVSTGLLSIPERNMHTAVEVVCLEDIENTARLAAEFILSCSGEDA